MTRADHPSVTDRIIEVMNYFPETDAFINIQGDEPFIHPDDIDSVAKMLTEKGETKPLVTTLVKKISDPQLLANPSVVKVVLGNENQAIYFSRSPIPYLRNELEKSEWTNKHSFWQHVGIYGYNSKALQQISKLQPSILEKAESLEQLRWIENGIPIFTAETSEMNLSVDTSEDLALARKYYLQNNQQ